MSARIKYSTGDGNTIPYPPLFDEIRRNYGFIDTRGHPDRVAEIPEAQESRALAALLTKLAIPNARLVSLGCDLGQHDVPKARIEARRVAGGYVQIVAGNAGDYDLKFLQSVAKEIEYGLKAAANADRWEVNLQLAPVFLAIEEVEVQSIWLWFFAEASTSDRAIASRERLIKAIEQIIAIYGT